MTYRYVTDAGLSEYCASKLSQMEQFYGSDMLSRVLFETEARMLAFIIPNTPLTEAAQDAFCTAVYAQMLYEYQVKASQKDLPFGAKSFSLGNFSMSFDAQTDFTTLSRKNIAPAAYALLLREGLLYRGVERTGAFYVAD